MSDPHPTMEQILREAEELEKAQPMLGRIHLYLPLLIMAGIAVFLFVIGEFAKYSAAGLAALPVGKFIILGGAFDQQLGLNQWQLALMVVVMDTWVAYVLAYNLHHVYKIPRVGPWLHDVQNYCRYWLHEYPIMRRWALSAVVMFVVFPLSGTGAPGGALLGRIVGLRPRNIVAAIFVGSTIGCGIMAAFAVQIKDAFEPVMGTWWFKAIGISIIVILLFVLWRLGVRISRAASQFAHAETTKEQPES